MIKTIIDPYDPDGGSASSIVSSVNQKTADAAGNVALTAADVGADAAGSAAAVAASLGTAAAHAATDFDSAGSAAAVAASLKAVATSGDYADLSNKPTAADVGAATAAQGAKADTAVQPDQIGTAASHAETDFDAAGAAAAVAAAAMPKSGGAFTGPVTLAGDPSASNQPATKGYVDDSIAAAAVAAGGAPQVNSDWTATSGVAQILNKPTLGTAATADASAFDAAGAAAAVAATLKTVATSGSYNDLIDKPDLSGISASGIVVANVQTGEAYTPVADDVGKEIQVNGTAPVVTIDASVFSPGSTFVVRQTGNGQVSFVPATGTTLLGPSGALETAGKGQIAFVRIDSTTEAYIGFSGSSGSAAALQPSGVSAGTYGDATHFPIVTVDVNGIVTDVSQQDIPASGKYPVNAQSVASYKPIGSDAGSEVRMTNASTVILDVSGFADGQFVRVRQAGSGSINFTAASGTTIIDGGQGLSTAYAGAVVEATFDVGNASVYLNGGLHVVAKIGLSGSTPDGVVGYPYTGSLNATLSGGAIGPVTITVDTLPTGLVLSTTTGSGPYTANVTGTPTTSESITPTFTASNGTTAQNGTYSDQIVIAAQSGLSMSAVLPSTNVGVAYSGSVTVARQAGASGAMTIGLASGSTFPGGISWNGAVVDNGDGTFTRAISGSATTSGDVTISFTSTDGVQTGTLDNEIISVAAAGTPQFIQPQYGTLAGYSGLVMTFSNVKAGDLIAIGGYLSPSSSAPALVTDDGGNAYSSYGGSTNAITYAFAKADAATLKVTIHATTESATKYMTGVIVRASTALAAVSSEAVDHIDSVGSATTTQSVGPMTTAGRRVILYYLNAQTQSSVVNPLASLTGSPDLVFLARRAPSSSNFDIALYGRVATGAISAETLTETLSSDSSLSGKTCILQYFALPFSY